MDENRTWRILSLPSLAELWKLRNELQSLFSTIRAQCDAISTALTYQDSWISSIVSEEGDGKRIEGNRSEDERLQKNFLEHLNALQSALQTQVAQVMLCKDVLMKYDTEPSETLDTIVKTFSTLKTLNVTVSTSAESASHSLDRLVQKHQSGPDTSLGPERSTKNYGDFESHFEPSNANVSGDSTGLGSFLDLIPKNASIMEKVFEAETGDDVEEEIKPSTLSREERIALAKKAREDARKQEEEVFSKLNFVMELKDVLSLRVEERDRLAKESNCEAMADLQ